MSNEPQHPGAYIRAHVIPSGLNVTAAAKQLDVSRPALSNLLNGKADLSAEMATRMEVAFGASAILLLELQNKFDNSKINVNPSNLGAAPYVPPFLQIKAINIEEWSESGIRPRQRLSVFLRTLINSTGSMFEKVDFPGNDDSELEGWDGYVQTANPTQWIPTGRSGWEFGVTRSAKAKADHDFAKSVKAIDASERRQTTFVFVTPRRWSGKAAWIKDHKTKNLWKDVRAYDASDLEQWLEQSLAAQTWFASEIGQEAWGTISLDQAWRSWAADCEPIPSSILFADAVKSHRSKIESAVTSNSFQPIKIAADSRDEALAFLSVVFSADNAKLGTFRDRIIIFRNTGSLTKMVAKTPNFIPVIISREVEEEFAPVRNSIPAFLIYPRNSTVEDPDILLEPLNHEAFEASLRSMGVDRDRIDQLSHESGRSITVLRRRLSKLDAIRTPSWSTSSTFAKNLIPFSFAGSWKKYNSADTAVLEMLAGGVKYEEIERHIADLLVLDGTPVWSEGEMNGVISKIDVLFAIKNFIGVSDLQRFIEVSNLVLSEEDPALELPENDRWAAGIYGKTREISGALRSGLAETVVLLAVHGRSLFQARLSFDAEKCVNNLVRSLLSPLTIDTLESQSDKLTFYAEAAPETFLSIIEKDLEGPDPETLKLLRPIGDAFFSTSPRTGLLWAFEGLAWSQTLFLRTVLVLGKLAERRIDDNLVNKPIESLRAIFRSWMPQTSAKLEARKKALSMLALLHPNVAWVIYIDQISINSSAGQYSHKPRWRLDGHNFGDPVSLKERNEFELYALEKMLNWPTHTEKTICELIENSDGVADNLQIRIWDVVDSWLLAASENEKANVKEKIRVSTMTRRAMSFRETRVTALVAARAKKIYEHLEIIDPVTRHAWLFKKVWVEESVSEIIDSEMDYRKRDERIAQMRRIAVSDVFSAGGVAAVVKLAEAGEASHNVGWFLAAIIDDDEKLSAEIVCIVNGSEITGPCAGLLTGALAKSNIDRRPVLEKVIAGIDSSKILDILPLAPFERSTWDQACNLGKIVENGYWRKVNPFWVENREDLLFSMKKMIEMDRPRAAFSVAHLDIKKLPPLFLLDLMVSISVGSKEAEGSFRLDQHDLREAFQFLTESNEIGVEALASLEFRYIDIFDHSKIRPTNLERQIENQPDVFVHALVLAFRRSDDGTDPSEFLIGDKEQHSSRARAAYKLMDNISRIPGRGDNGLFDSVKLIGWIEYVRSAAQKLSRVDVADQMIGRLLANAPLGGDDIWPIEPVRDVLELVLNEHIGRGVSVALFNARGTHWRGVGGGQERELAAKYARWAEGMEYTHPHLSALLRRMERSYLRDAEKEDDDERISRRLRH